MKIAGKALLAGWALALASCSTYVGTTAAAGRLPAEKRAVLESETTSAQRDAILAYATSKYGGFSKEWVKGAVLITVNGERGTDRARDPRGAFATESLHWTLNCEAGPLKILSKPMLFFDGDPKCDDVLEFDAKPGHRYCVATAYQIIYHDARWVPVVYDRTEERVIPLAGLTPKRAHLPASAYTPPPFVYVVPR